MNILARVMNRAAWLVLLGMLAAVAAAAFYGVPVFGALTGGNPDFTTPGSESVRVTQILSQETGIDPDGGMFALVTSGASINDLRTRAEVHKVAAIMAAEPVFTQVQTYYQAHDKSLVSNDGRQTLVIGTLRESDRAQFNDVVNDLTAKYKDDPDVQLGGSEAVGTQIVSVVQHDLRRSELTAFPILFILSLLIFRGMLASALPLVIGGSNIALALLGMRVVNHYTSLSIFALNLITALGMGLAIDYSLLVVSRFRLELADGTDVPTAITNTLRTAGRTVLFSSLTVSAAMTSLFAFRQRILYSFAVGGVLVAVSSTIVALILLPAILRLLGRRIDFMSPRRWRVDRADAEATRGGWFSLARNVMRSAPAIAALAVVALIVTGLPFAKVAFTSVDAQDLPTSQSSRVVDDIMLSRFPSDPLDTINVLVLAPEGQGAQPGADSLRAQIVKLPGIASVSAITLVSGETALIQVSPSQPGLSATSQQLVRDIRGLHSQDQVVVGGQTANFLDLKSSILRHLPLAALIVVLVTGLLLILMTGSIVLPLEAFLLNLLTLSATFGILVLVFQDGHLSRFLGASAQGSLDVTQPVLLFALVFGLSTDYGVFLLSRIKESRDFGAHERRAVTLGVGRTGRIVSAAAILFCVAVGALATSQIVFIKELGVGTALGVLIDATVIRVLLVPSLMRILGRWNWWGPEPLRKLSRVFGESELGDGLSWSATPYRAAEIFRRPPSRIR